MSKLHPQNRETKISRLKTLTNEMKRRGANCNQVPAFSFQFLTTNKSYTFEYFSKSMKREMHEAKHLLLEKLLDITQNSWMSISGMRKDAGLETIPKDEMEFSPNGYEIAEDGKYTVFRFGSGHNNYRLIGFRMDSCPIYYIAGYDFDFSAYNHG